MEASKAAGGGREDDININMADNNNGMHCSDHPYRTNPGGICAFCLQDKLGKLVSSSLPLPIAPSSHSSSSPSFPSQTPPPSSLINNAATTTTTTTTTTHHKRLPFLLAKKKKKATPSSSSSSETDNIIFKRSKSTATPRRGIGIGIDDYSPRRKNGFWSFLYLSSNKSSASATKLVALNGNKHKEKCLVGSSVGRKFEIVDNNNNTQNSVSAPASAFERKVSRSRSVGCGSRSFSGDFFERISTGLGDCTLRRVESQREGKSKAAAAVAGAAVSHHHQCMKERVKCAGLFGGFMMTTTSSSSSSSSSSYLVSSSSAGGDDHHHHHHHHHHQMNGRARSWGWAFASPMRAFGTKPNSSSKENNIITKASSSSSDHNNASTTTTPNLSDLPSFLAIRV